MKTVLACTIALFALTGCTSSQRSPDAIRQDTAKVTSTAVKDAKAVAKGMADGLKQKGPININKASADDLETLQGIDAPVARRIIAGRPYENSSELVKRHLISKDEYDQISGKIVAE